MVPSDIFTDLSQTEFPTALSAQQGATRGVRSKFAPFQRRETSAASQMTSGNTSDNGAFDDEGVLRTWRAMSPNLQEKWPEAARPEDWEGVTMENGRVVKLELDGFEMGLGLGFRVRV